MALQRLGAKLVQYGKNLLSDILDKLLGGYKKEKEWAVGVTLTSRRDLILWTDGFWWSYTGSFPHTISSGEAPFVDGKVASGWVCMGKLEGYDVTDVRNFDVFPDVGDVTDKLKYCMRLSEGDGSSRNFPAGVYDFTDLGTLRPNRVNWTGVPNMGTVLRCNNTEQNHVAIKIDAWPLADDPNQPFIDGFKMSGFHIEGNDKTICCLEMQGVSRSHLEDVTVWGTTANGTGIRVRASSLNQFDRVMTSHFRTLAGSANKPQYGMHITTGYRAGAFQGSPSNNLFNNLYMEGVQRGLYIEYGDQNTFAGGSCEGNSDYGTYVAAGCRYNSFIGMGNENLNAPSGDFIILGHYTLLENTYGSQKVSVNAGARGTRIFGGYFERIQVLANAVNTKVWDVTVNHWNTGEGGFVDQGINTDSRDIYDSDLPGFIVTSDVRKAATLTTVASGSNYLDSWVNDTRSPVTVFVIGATAVTAVKQYTNQTADPMTLVNPQNGVAQYLLYHNDKIEFTRPTSGAKPGVSYRRFRWN